MKRIFIALKVKPGEILTGMISALKTGLNNEVIKWTSPSNIHITLVFLGDTEEHVISQIRSMLHEKCAGSGKFELIMKGAGIFRSMKDPRIIWSGIEPSEKFQWLHRTILDGLNGLNINIEDRPFSPHLTIGRIKRLKDKDRLKSLIEEYQATVIQTIPVSEVILYESILLQAGPLYNELAVFPL